MKLLATIHPEDVDPDSPHFDYSTYKTRTAGRAVIFDGDKVALIHVSKRNYYMLPGGGVENEDISTALAREIMEELGCKAEIKAEIGSTEVYFDRWQQRQVDHCYIAQKVGGVTATSLTEFEIAEGYQTIWCASLEEAIKLVEEATPKNRGGRVIRARDLLFLKTVQKLTSQ